MPGLPASETTAFSHQNSTATYSSTYSSIPINPLDTTWFAVASTARGTVTIITSNATTATSNQKPEEQTANVTRTCQNFLENATAPVQELQTRHAVLRSCREETRQMRAGASASAS